VSWPMHAHGTATPGWAGSVLGRVVEAPQPRELRSDLVWLTERPSADAGGYAAVLTTATPPAALLDAWRQRGVVAVHGLSRRDHLAAGDVVALQPGGYVRTLYRRASPHNAVFVTDRCNSFCLMCSQPPRPVDDSDRIAEHLRLVDLIDPATRELGITGGEPTLLKDDLLRLVAHCRERLPATALHILSNGRLFYYGSLARRLAAVGHPDLMVGVPLYSDLDYEHDHVVQVAGAFHQTVIGLQNLGRYGVAVEIRVVVHRLTWQRLQELAEFIYRNFCFASHVTFMGLELMGFAVPNLERLWVDPHDAAEALAAAVDWLDRRGMQVSIYNHPLCLLPTAAQRFARRSISDWKNDYPAVCDGCARRDECCGFFTSSLRRRVSAHLTPFPAQPSLAASLAASPCDIASPSGSASPAAGAASASGSR
jgi:His-Xaa-Ser system radical SAM maturase HxsC